MKDGDNRKVIFALCSWVRFRVFISLQSIASSVSQRWIASLGSVWAATVPPLPWLWAPLGPMPSAVRALATSFLSLNDLLSSARVADPYLLDVWGKAVLYHFVHTFGLFAVANAPVTSNLAGNNNEDTINSISIAFGVWGAPWD